MNDKINFSELNEQLLQLYEMAQKQGTDKNFTYYTLDNEYSSHRPHVHVCVSINNKHWSGKNFKNGQNLQSVGSVFLPFEQLKNREPFTPKNLQFEEVIDNKITTSKYVKSICQWLNNTITDDFGNTINNAMKCFNDYKMSNGHNCKYLLELGGNNRNETT